MKELQDQILKLLERLEKSPSTVVSRPYYPAAKWLLWGYFWGIEQSTGIVINQQITQWVHAKTKKVSSVSWFDHICHYVANDDEDAAYQLMLGYLREFFKGDADTLFAEKES